MATHDYVIDNSTGANVRSDINNVLQAILTNNSSSSAPSTTAAYMWWADTTTGILKIRNSANDGWVELLQLDGTLTLEDGTVSAPGLAFRDDLNTGIFSSAADTFNVATGGVERMELGTSTIFNEDGADVDFRIEGSSISSMFFVDAGNNRVGISDGSPSCTFEVGGTTSQTAIFQSNQSATTVSVLDTDGDGINISGGTAFGHRILTSTTEALSFGVNNAIKMTLDSSGNLGIGTSVINTAQDIALSIFGTNGCELKLQSTNFGGNASGGGAAITYTFGSLFITNNSANGDIHFQTQVSGESTSEKMRLTEAGLLGVGSTSPSAGVHIVTTSQGLDVETSNAVVAEFKGSGAGGGYLGLQLGANGTAIGYLGRSGQLVGVGGSNENLALRAENELEFAITSGGTTTQRAKITSNGIETGNTITVATAANLVNPITVDDAVNNNFSTNAINFQKNSTGSVGSITCTRSATSYNTSSDYRLKENAVAISDGITRLKTLIPRRFNWISDETNTPVDGFFAHEVTAVPEAITGTKDEVATEDIDGKNIKKGDPIYQQIDQAKLVPLLVAAVQELITKVETLEAA